jgi:hypothetical protein
LAQQGWPAPPQDWQVAAMHLTEEAVQVLPAQQGCPAPV